MGQDKTQKQTHNPSVIFLLPPYGTKQKHKKFLVSKSRVFKDENAIIMIGGDFNIPDWDWPTLSLGPVTYPGINRTFKEGIEGCNVTQVINLIK